MIIERTLIAQFRSFFPKTMLALALSLVALSSDPISIGAQQPPRPQRKGDKTAAPSIATPQADVARGKYIVENVAMCPQCHTPRDDNGKLDRRHLLEGGVEFFQSPRPDPNWPLKAPRIGGVLPASDQDMIRLLTTGIWTDGEPLRLPMMPFRMSEADARSVVAYLKSVQQQN